jgi:hypothetical protein
LQTFVYLFGSIWCCPNVPKQHKTYFLVVLDQFFLQKWAYCFGLGLFFKLRHWAVHPTHLRAFVYLLRYIWGCPNAPKQHEKNYFLVVLDHFSYKNGPIDLVRGFFSSLDIGPYIPPTCGLFKPFWVHMGVPKCPKTASKNYFWLFWIISPSIMGLQLHSPPLNPYQTKL